MEEQRILETFIESKKDLLYLLVESKEQYQKVLTVTYDSIYKVSMS